MPNQIISKNNSLELSEYYDHFILDVWGVIHDGTSAYDGVVENLSKLRKTGKKIYFLSNAPRRATKVVATLEKFGITNDFYDLIMTSGEATYLSLKANQEDSFSKYGKNYYYIGPKKDQDLLSGLNYTEVQKASDANFAIVTGFDDELSKANEKEQDLKNCLEHNLPLLCVNPDLIVIKKSGQEMLCGGLIAKQYAKMGGEVVYFGKPHKAVYDTILSLADIDDKSRVVAIGDGIETDIDGANRNNIDSALIGGGILSNILNIKHGELPKKEDLTKLCKDYQIYPKIILAQL
jgi:HAD superfamily hydrolase (TIGR01459 family)